jgi:hypothetical protein
MSDAPHTERPALADRLRALRVEPEDDGFSASLHRRLAAAGPPDPLPLWRRLAAARSFELRLLWPALGLAAGVAVFLLLGGLRGPPGAISTQPGLAGMQAAATQLPSTKVAIVRMNLSAEVAVESAQIRINLPEGLKFWADGQELAQSSFEWSQPLEAGHNEIPIAVRGHRPGQYRLTVSALIGSQRVEDVVLLEVVDG